MVESFHLFSKQLNLQLTVHPATTIHMVTKLLSSFIFIFAILSLVAQEKFSFVFMADVHYHDKNGAPQAMDAAIDTINKLNPDFVMLGGDIIYDGLRRSESETMEQVRLFQDKAASIEAPIYYAIGNHDHFGLYNKEIEESHPLYGKRMYEKYFGSRYYSFDHEGWHFVVLDDMVVTDERKYIGRVDSLQLGWLKRDIEQISDTTPVVIMAHVPLITTLSQWYGGGTNRNHNRLAIENGDEVLKLFKNKNLRLILQGHIHYYEVLQILNQTTVISAPSFSGKWWMGKMNEMEEGFVRITVDEDNDIHTQYIDYEWDGE